MVVYTVQDYVVSIAILLIILWFISRYLFTLIPLDQKFMLILVPYILFGIFFRMMVDIGTFEANSYWNVTPGVYIVTVLFGLGCTAIGILISRFTKIDYWIFPVIIGFAAAILYSFKLMQGMIHPARILYPLILASSITIAIYAASSFSPVTKIFQRRENVLIIFAHLLDGSATFIGINLFGFSEEHLLPDYLITLAGNNAIIMIPLKIIVILFALYVIEKWYKEEIQIKKDIKKDTEYYYLFKIIFFILGIGPGIRDALLPALI